MGGIRRRLSPFSPPDRERKVNSPALSARGSLPSRRMKPHLACLYPAPISAPIPPGPNFPSEPNLRSVKGKAKEGRTGDLPTSGSLTEHPAHFPHDGVCQEVMAMGLTRVRGPDLWGLQLYLFTPGEGDRAGGGTMIFPEERPIFVTFWKRQNCGDSKKNPWFPGVRRYE